MKIKIHPEDKAYSEYLRARYPFCQACEQRRSTQVHHYFGRAYQAGRFCDENCWAVCFLCHRKFETDPRWSEEMARKRFQIESEYVDFCIRMKIVTPRKKFEKEILRKYFLEEAEKWRKINGQ